jgi:hypothetical protein
LTPYRIAFGTGAQFTLAQAAWSVPSGLTGLQERYAFVGKLKRIP